MIDDRQRPQKPALQAIGSVPIRFPLAPYPNSLYTVRNQGKRRLRLKMFDPLVSLRLRYRQVADQVREIGFVAVGSLVSRMMVCGTPGCRCHQSPPQLHGPYFQLTRKVAGKTLTRRLTAEQAELYKEWLDNNRRLRRIVAEMEQVSSEAIEIILQTNRLRT